MEELTVIRVKRTLESEPLQHISLASKKLKLDSSAGISVVATINSTVSFLLIYMTTYNICMIYFNMDIKS